MPRDSDMLTVREVAKLLRLHPSAVYRLLRENKLRGFKVGRSWRFKRSDLEALSTRTRRR